MKLATAAEVLARVNVSNTVAGGSTDAVESSLEAASILVASILQTPLEIAERVDWFDYTPSKYQGTFGTLSLKLHQRFVTEEKVKVYYSKDGTVAQATTDLLALDTDFSVNRVSGIVELYKEPIKGIKTVAVKYEAGFDNLDTCVPSWMKEAAISAALHVHHAHKIGHDSKDQPSMAKVMAGILYTQLNHYIVVNYESHSPTDSVVQ